MRFHDSAAAPPARYHPPVSQTVASVETAAAIWGGHITTAAANHTAAHTPMPPPISGKYCMLRMRNAGWWSHHPGQGSLVRNMMPVQPTHAWVRWFV